ncbi:MAG: long-chain fatty acid--CoA ligase, partial [Bdellovibrionales bacterium]|nr:long-chain fatty acid--CoA ligase [Bdellovibrionales bacterium]
MANKKTVPQLFVNRVSKNPDANAIGWIEGDNVIFYRHSKYQEIVEALSLGLVKLGLQAGEKLSILSHTCVKWHLCDIATMCARGVVVPLYPNYLSQEIQFIINHSESKIAVVENDEQLLKIIEIQEKTPQLQYIIGMDELSSEATTKIRDGIEYISYSTLLTNGQSEREAAPNLFKELVNDGLEGDLASIIYTSGTTGTPKGAVITQHAFSSMLENVAQTLHGGIDTTDRNLVFLPLSHVLGRCDSMLFLGLGNETVYAESLEKVVDNLAVARPTVLVAVPRIFEKVHAKIMQQIESGSPAKKALFNLALKVSENYFNALERDQSPSTLSIIQRNLAYKVIFSKIYNKFGGNVRFFVSGGAPISKEIIHFLRHANLTILEGYGLTETVAACVLNPLGRQIAGTVGVPLNNVKMKFAEDGEILLKTDAMFSEYYKNEEATKEALKDGWLYTGDIGELDEHGHLKITDRKKDIIITSAGKNIAPQKIEGLMKLKPHISHFMVIGDQHKYLTAIVGIEKEPFLDDFDKLGIDRTISVEEMSKHPEIRQL